MDFDVIILGAGVSGLAAGRVLSRRGQKLAILEARNRIGGRIHTIRESGLASPVELGAEFVHGLPRESWDLIDSGHLGCCEVPQQTQVWEKLERVLSELDSRVTPDRSFLQYLEAKFPKPENREERNFAKTFVQGFHAAELSRISERSLALGERQAQKSEGHRAFRLLDGYDRLPARMATEIRERDPEALFLNHWVTAVNWKRDSVEVIARPRIGHRLKSFTAPKLLVTLPLGVLKAATHLTGSVRFSPRLESKLGAFEQLEMGGVVKIGLSFKRAFWESLPGHFDSSFIHSSDPSFHTWWTSLPLRTPLITGWAGGPAAKRLAGLREDELVTEALDSLSRVLGERRERMEGLLENWFTHDWHADPFSRGAYSYVGVGGMETLPAQRVLAEPVEGTLFFAGEATHWEGAHGTVDGAIASGYRAAREILAISVLEGRLKRRA